MRTPEQFEWFYQTHLLPQLEQFEGYRKRVVWGLVAAIALAVVLNVVVWSLPRVSMRNDVWKVIAFFAGLWGPFIYYAVMGHWIYKRRFKQLNLIGPLVAFLNPALQYQSEGFVPEQAFTASRLFDASAERYRGEDLVWGQIGQTAFQFSEIHAESLSVSTDGKGNVRQEWQPIFRGLFFMADFNKHFHGVTAVLPNYYEKALYRFAETLNGQTRGNLVRLEDVEFERRHAVYSTDEIEARYLLTPGLMARIVAFEDRTGQPIWLSFVNSMLFVAIPQTRDLFAPKLFRPVNNPAMAQAFVDDLMLGIGLVEELNLNTRIWTKQPVQAAAQVAPAPAPAPGGPGSQGAPQWAPISGG